jgi:thiol-disulfide isomerase/thioredoxin
MNSSLLKTILCIFAVTFYALSQDTVSAFMVFKQDTTITVFKSREDLTKAIQLTIDESIGKKAPPLYLQDIQDNSSHELSDYSDKVILLNFWARGCIPCMAELPDIGYLQDEYEKAGLKVIFVSREDTDSQHRFFRIHEVSGMKAKISGNYSFLYCLGTPEFILIDSNGTIKDVWMGAIGYDAMEKRINAIIPRDAKSFKLHNPRLVLLSSVGLFGVCLIIISIVWNKKKKKAA